MDDKEKKAVALRLAYEIPAANIVGIFLAIAIGEMWTTDAPSVYFVENYFSYIWPWVPLATCVWLLIIARPHWSHFLLYAVYLYFLVTIFFPVFFQY